jgi:hypothetical protein
LRSTYVLVRFPLRHELTRSVQYRGGTLVRHPLLLSGLFSFPSPLPNHVHHFHYPLSTPPHSRQDSSHPHQIIPISQDGKTFLGTDLGTDRLIELRWEGAEDNGSWNELRQYSVEAQNGPRHGVKQGAFSSFLFFALLPPFLSHLHFAPSLAILSYLDAYAIFSPSGSLLYLVNEIAATVSVHPLPAPSTALNASSISPTHLPSIATFAVLPPNLRDAPRVGGFDRIPSTILLLDPRPDAPPNSPSTLLISHRNAPPELSPEGDTFLQYSVHPTEPTKLVDPIFHSGAGLHIRGLSAGPTAGAEKECFVLALGRDYGGLSMYERKKDGSLQLIVKNALGQEIEKPVVAVWLP